MNADKILFRCHSLGDLLTDPRKGSKEELSETCKKRLVKVYVKEKYGRENELDNKYVNKGLQVEEDGITLYSRLKKKVYFKNEETLFNGMISGTPDFGDNKDIKKSETIIDTKCSWDIFTFFNSQIAPTDKDYYWQAQGYMALTGARSVNIAYCLIDTPEPFIIDEKRKMMWKMGVINPDNDKLYLDACAEIEKNMTYADIPLKERMFERQIIRDNEAIERICLRIEQCRRYMNTHLFGEVIKREAAVEL